MCHLLPVLLLDRKQAQIQAQVQIQDGHHKNRLVGWNSRFVIS